MDNAVLDILLANMVREVKTLPVGVKDVKDTMYRSGIYIRFENDGTKVTATLIKGSKKRLVAQETYKGSTATANNKDRAVEKVKTSVWRGLAGVFKQFM
jgi:hypothetical protein